MNKIITLAQAKENMERKNCVKYAEKIKEQEYTYEGISISIESVLTDVKNIIKNIDILIERHGADFKVPTQDNEIPKKSRDLFFGCVGWTR